MDKRRPTTLDNDMLRVEVVANSGQTSKELSNTLNQPWLTIQVHLQQINKVIRTGVLVLLNLSEENKLLQQPNTEAFFDCLITGDEKWVLYDNSECKKQWISLNELSRNTAKPILHP